MGKMGVVGNLYQAEGVEGGFPFPTSSFDFITKNCEFFVKTENVDPKMQKEHTLQNLD